MKTNIYLDVRSEDAFGNCPIKISVSHKTRTFYINTGARAPRAYWDNNARRVTMRCRNNTTINACVLRIKASVDSVILRMQLDGSLASIPFDKLPEVIKSEVSPAPLDVERGEFSRCFDEFLSSRRKENTRQTYESTRSRLKSYCKDYVKLTFSDVDYKFLVGFESWLEGNGCPSVNGRSAHFRNIRAVFNHAILMDYTTIYPFRKFKIKNAKTRHRAMSIPNLKKLWSYKPERAAEEYALDIFKLSFALIGINMADLYTLKYDESVLLQYTRDKTGRPYTFAVQPVAVELANKHAGRDNLIDASERYASVHCLTIAVNKYLKRICERLGIPPVTTYWARHTWATIASHLNVPKETIAEALGHGNSVTDGYIDYEIKKINEANELVINYVENGCE